jgi:hypothetical protein
LSLEIYGAFDLLKNKGLNSFSLCWKLFLRLNKPRVREWAKTKIFILLLNHKTTCCPLHKLKYQNNNLSTNIIQNKDLFNTLNFILYCLILHLYFVIKHPYIVIFCLNVIFSPKCHNCPILVPKYELLDFGPPSLPHFAFLSTVDFFA